MEEPRKKSRFTVGYLLRVLAALAVWAVCYSLAVEVFPPLGALIVATVVEAAVFAAIRGFHFNFSAPADKLAVVLQSFARSVPALSPTKTPLPETPAHVRPAVSDTRLSRPVRWFCDKCGKEISPDDNFCDGCGESIPIREFSPPASVPPPAESAKIEVSRDVDSEPVKPKGQNLVARSARERRGVEALGRAVCPACGKKLRTGKKFCTGCGYGVGE